MAPRLVDRELTELFRQDRTIGPHVSTALKNVMQSLYPARFGDDSKLNQDRLDLGNAMENALADAWAHAEPDRYTRPGELEFEGIYGTPDLWDLAEWATVEIKLTWASSKRAEDIEDTWFWRYWQQLKSYAHMAGMTKGYLVIFFVNGNYSYGSDSSGPTGMMWEDEWEPEELAETWDMIKANL
jgi:hypothetical protein